MKRTKIYSLLALLLAMVMLFCACSAATPAPVEEKPQEGTSTENVNEPAKTDEAAEPVKLHAYFLNSPGSTERFASCKDSEVYKTLVEKTGVDLTVEGVDVNKAQVILAGGDTTDLLSYQYSTDVQNSIEGGQLLPLNDLIEKYAPNIANLAPERLDMAKRLFGDEDGNFYALPINAGLEGCSNNIDRFNYIIRWDLYADMGYPEVKNGDDMLKLLAEMQKMHPENENGDKTYGMGFAISNGATQGFDKRFWYTYGYRNSTDNILTKVSDQTMVFNYTDDGSPFWQAAEYYNKAYRMGLLDPDSLSMQEADYKAKIEAGVYLSPDYATYAKAYVAAQNDPDTHVGFESIPVEGTTVWINSNQIGGWEMWFLAIPKTCSNPEAAIKLLNYTFGYEGARLLKSGAEGTHWNVVDGELVPTDEAIRLLQVGGDELNASGIRTMNMLCGLSDCTVADDGAILCTFRSATYLSSNISGADKDYCEHYGVEYPVQQFLNMKADGKANDHSGLDMRLVVGMGNAPEDIQRIDTNLQSIAVNSIAKLIMAEDDAAFAAVKAQVLQELADAGAATSREWWQARHDQVKADFGIQ